VIHTGDCLAVMRTMPAESVDAVVTDPPAGIAFMSRKWDHNKGGRTQWVAWMTEVMGECYRLLKPGGYAVVWSLPRTCHWTGWAMEDAGFYLVDQLAHVFASGFPKGKTQLKPAREDWWLARKPGPLRPLAIDACRISTDGEEFSVPQSDPLKRRGMGGESVLSGKDTERNKAAQRESIERTQTLGRWPSNLLLSDPELFDVANPYVVGSGATSEDGVAVRHRGIKPSSFSDGGELPDLGYGGGGGYSRFFIISKADRGDREPVLRGQQLGKREDVPLVGIGAKYCGLCGEAWINQDGWPRCGHGREHTKRRPPVNPKASGQ
jgi:hypothetical protein